MHEIIQKCFFLKYKLKLEPRGENNRLNLLTKLL